MKLAMLASMPRTCIDVDGVVQKTTMRAPDRETSGVVIVKAGRLHTLQLRTQETLPRPR